MWDSFEFVAVRHLRRSLIIVSLIGIIVSQLVEYSIGDIDFFGFTLKENNKFLLSKIFGWVIIFFTVALTIRYFNEEFIRRYNMEMRSMEVLHNITVVPNRLVEIDKRRFDNKVRWINTLSKALKFSLDIVFPFGIGLVSIGYCFMTL